MSKNLEQEIRQIIADVLGVTSDEFTAETSPDDVASWDSLRHIQMIFALEDELGVSIPEADVPTLLSIRAIEDLVRSLRSGQADR